MAQSLFAKISALGTKILNRIEPETAHRLALSIFKTDLYRPKNPKNHTNPLLARRIGNLTFPNPVGLAPGFDKDGAILPALNRLGFGFIEVGAVTLNPQPGNPKPRLFRLTEDGAIINRMGFNSCGLEEFRENLSKFKKSNRNAAVPLGVNLGLNKTSTTPLEDYAQLVKALKDLADYLTINLSSPNTPGLRDLQNPEFLERLLTHLNKEIPDAPPLFVKFSPDMPDEAYAPLIEVALKHGIEGIVVTNTTLSREGLVSENKKETGGLSGAPLKARSQEILKLVSPLVKNRAILISSGGIADGTDAFDRLKAGADLLQIYTSFILQGPAIVEKIQNELCEIMSARNIRNLDEIR